MLLIIYAACHGERSAPDIDLLRNVPFSALKRISPDAIDLPPCFDPIDPDIALQLVGHAYTNIRNVIDITRQGIV